MTDKTNTGITMSPDGLEFPDGSKIHADGAITGPLAEALAPMILRAAEALRKNLARAAAPAATDRDILAEAIAHAAEKRGIIKAGTALTGPQLVMLCADLAEPPPVLLQAATARPADDLAPHPELQLIMSQQPVQAAGDDFTAHSPDCRNYGCTGCADPAELSRLLAPVIAAPTAPIDLSKLTKWGAGMIAVGWQDDKELYVKVSDLERTLSAPTATAEPVETDLTCDKLALLLVGKHVNDYGYRMLLNGEEIGFNLQDLLDIVKLAAPVPQQAPLTDEAIERAASTQEGAKNA